jgi:hypothetical protein
MELPVAKYFSVPIITVLPKDSHHRRSNVVFRGTLVEDWIHPFVYAFSDKIVENIDEVDGKMIQSLKVHPKDLTIIDEAIARAERKTA